MKLTEDQEIEIISGRVLALTMRSIASSMGVLLNLLGEEEFKRAMSGTIDACIAADKEASKEASKEAWKAMEKQQDKHQKKVKK